MAGVTVTLPFLRAEGLTDEVNIAAGGPQQAVLAGCIIVSHSALDQMPQAIELMMVSQIGEDLVCAAQDIEGVQITVFQLSTADDLNGLVCDGLQLRIRMLGE